ncbi:MAG TPA: hypothetical protein RMH26_14780 [Polyangiaceae bacterium LLY-WYZ-15_(1-7)]|nr:hypothetical protein [Polyangiaceae bacterium LLY-WYZ-15_(1-7)]
MVRKDLNIDLPPTRLHEEAVGVLEDPCIQAVCPQLFHVIDEGI